jgi:hypothetical protein
MCDMIARPVGFQKKGFATRMPPEFSTPDMLRAFAALSGSGSAGPSSGPHGPHGRSNQSEVEVGEAVGAGAGAGSGPVTGVAVGTGAGAGAASSFSSSFPGSSSSPGDIAPTKDKHIMT